MNASESVLFWISQEIFQWHPLSGGGSICNEPDTLLRRPYRMLRHAENKLKPSATELDLIDSITTLKRAAYERKDALIKQYELKRIPISGLPHDHLERLAFLEIIRPVVLKTLVDIRNYIEHEKARPPDLERCKEIAEYVWYFLRSTDSLLKVINDFYTLYSEDDEYWIEVRTGPSHAWKIEVRGWLPKDLFSKEEQQDWVEVRGVQRLAAADQSAGSKERDHQDVYVGGQILGPTEALVTMYRQYYSQV